MDNGSVIITGGTGFVGRHLISELQAHSSFSRIVVLDRSALHLPPGVEGYAIDITNPDTYENILRDVRPSWVVHLAAVSSVGLSLQNEELTRTVNVFSTEELVKRSIAAHDDTRFLVISSADIYGKVGSDPLTELPLEMAHPSNPYAQSKLEMEQIIERSYNDRCIRVRPFPHIGPGQNTGFVTSDFASQIAAIEKGKQEPTMLVGNLEARRDFTDVRDVVRAYRLLMEKGVLGEVYHVASSKVHSIAGVLDALLAMSNADIEIQQDPSRMRPSDNPVLVGAIDKITKVTGWKPEIPLDVSLKDILEDWRARA